jgi:hypothetical protein
MTFMTVEIVNNWNLWKRERAASRVKQRFRHIYSFLGSHLLQSYNLQQRDKLKDQWLKSVGKKEHHAHTHTNSPTSAKRSRIWEEIRKHIRISQLIDENGRFQSPGPFWQRPEYALFTQSIKIQSTSETTSARPRGLKPVQFCSNRPHLPRKGSLSDWEKEPLHVHATYFEDEWKNKFFPRKGITFRDW